MTPSPSIDRIVATTRLALLEGDHEGDIARGLQKLRADAMTRRAEDSTVIHVHRISEVAARHRGALLLAPAGPVLCGPEPHAAVAEEPARPVALMFPGLGDHYLNMGRGLHDQDGTFRTEVARCAELLAPELGLDLRDVLYPARAAAPTEAPARPVGLDFRRMVGRDVRAQTAEERRLNETRFAQPILFVVEYALARVWQAWGLSPAAMIGYSLGEYVAACLAGVLSLEDSLTLVARRAQLIESLPPGAMLAVGLSEAEVSNLLGDHLSVSAVNAASLCVVAGPAQEIEALEQRLGARDVAMRRVASTHAFHTRMMDPIADRVTRLVAGYALSAPRTPYVSNVTGELITAAQATDPSYWATHLCRPVRFAEGLRALASLPSGILLESGPGQTLGSIAMMSRGTRTDGEPAVVTTMRHALDPQPDVDVLLRALGRLWLAGAALDWGRFHSSALSLADEPSAEATASPAAPGPVGSTEQAAIEHQLRGIWAKLLGGVEIVRDASFFEIGGNSLIATRLVHLISRAFGVNLSLRRVYDVPTLSTMARAIDAERTGGGAAPAAPAGAAVRTVARYRLPNGMMIFHQNEGETRHFYDDIFTHRAYVRHGIQIPDGACVFDVGGNIGLFTLFAHREAKDVRVFTFEPAPPLFDILSRNVAEHGVRATLLNIGLSDEEADAPLTFYPRSSGMSSFRADEAEERHNLRTIIENQRRTGLAAEVDLLAPFAEQLLDVRLEAKTFTAKLRRLSDVLREHGIDRVDLLKVDVQRCELEVIEGIDEADWPKIRQIVLEVHDIDGRVAMTRSLLESHGFSVVSLQDELYVGTNIHNVYAVRSAE